MHLTVQGELVLQPQLSELFHRLMNLLACTSLSVCMCVRQCHCHLLLRCRTSRTGSSVLRENHVSHARRHPCPCLWWPCGCPVAALMPARAVLQGGSLWGGSGPLVQSLPLCFTPLQYTLPRAALSLTS